MNKPSATAETTNNTASSASIAPKASTSSDASTGSAGASASANGSSRGNDAASIAEAIEQMKLAAASVCEAVGTLRSASSSTAKSKLDDGKLKARGFEAQAESAISEKPLIYLGAAFAAGWLVSKLMKSS